MNRQTIGTRPATRVLMPLVLLAAGIGLVARDNPDPPAAEEKPLLHVVNWSWYIELDDRLDKKLSVEERSPTLREFCRLHGCRVKYIEFDEEVQILDYLTQHSERADVVNLPPDNITDLMVAKRLWRLPAHRTVGVDKLLPHIRGQLKPEAWAYMRPFLSGLTGLLYRKDLVGGTLDSWKPYFNPGKGVKVAGLDTSRTMLGLALKSLGYSINASAREQLHPAARLVMEMKRRGSLVFVSSNLDLIQERINQGAFAMVPMYSGDALNMVEDDRTGRLAYCNPKEGGEFFVDAWTIPKASKRKNLALAFINFMLRPDIQARNARYLKFQPVTVAGNARLFKAYPTLKRDPNINIPTSLLGRYELINRKDSVYIERLWDRIIKAR